jgi:hypothetical protein
MDSARFQPLQIEQWRERLRKKSDEELIRFGRAALGMCSPEANFGHPPRSIFVDQLQEARAEWRRRHPTPAVAIGSAFAIAQEPVR